MAPPLRPLLATSLVALLASPAVADLALVGPTFQVDDMPLIPTDFDGAKVAIDTDGTVTVWSTETGEALFTVDADSATPRLIGESIGSRATSAVSFDGTRLAIRYPAQGTERVRYEIIDLESWLP